MKKLLALLLCLVMVVSMFAGCGGNGNNSTTAGTTPDDTTPPDTTAAPVEAEPIPEAAYHWSFDDATGLTAVTQVEQAADSINDGAGYDIGASDHDILFANGPVGQCLYLDGKYGVQLDLESLDTDEYTISFWLNADRLADFGPTVQLGRNLGDAGDDRTVTWINFTKAAWGANAADLFPVAWNRNSEANVWPWVACYDDTVHGKKEWILVTIVSTGEKYTYGVAETGAQEDRIGCQYYLNGNLVFDAPAMGEYQGLSPEILSGDGIEGYIGVNYWDTIFKGFIDELYIFKTALTAGQVLSLYQEGDPTVASVAPEYEYNVEEPEEPAAPALPEITPDASAIDTIGTTDLTLGFWTDWSDGYELADGSSVTVKLNNYSSGAANWNNFLIGLVNVPTVGHTPPADQSADYAEYAVIRADAFGWGDASYAGNFEISWEDWNEWLQLMTDADVTLVLTRNGGEVTINMTFVGADGTTMTEKAVITSTLTADAPCYFFLLGEACYIEILSVE